MLWYSSDSTHASHRDKHSHCGNYGRSVDACDAKHNSNMCTKRQRRKAGEKQHDNKFLPRKGELIKKGLRLGWSFTSTF